MFNLKRLSKPYGKRSRLKITFHRHSVGKETTIKPRIKLYYFYRTKNGRARTFHKRVGPTYLKYRTLYFEPSPYA